ncbi:cell division protein FtsI [Roseateles amylovorans]|uniref:Cell division protein FtsI n=1 Tax=Roseateles amylovorans TaxID=2978473 RepID=A0ABY6B3B2_9BURK|nr:cell division protein FtsI [Roseateles amylovorans]UXH79210.1 cell division protein FtsI [Roseateles amylovorans]
MSERPAPPAWSAASEQGGGVRALSAQEPTPMRRRRGGQGLTASPHPWTLGLVLPLMAALLGGCSVLSPLPAWELVKATGTATSAAIATAAPAKASHTVHHGDAPVRDLCIEYNRNAPLEDLVPALQAELRGQGVESRVYEPGTGLQQCGVWLRYVATIEWGVPPMASGYRPNLSAAALSLHRADGTLMATSSYQIDQNLGLARWAPTRHKIAPVVKALITGFES